MVAGGRSALRKARNQKKSTKPVVRDALLPHVGVCGGALVAEPMRRAQRQRTPEEDSRRRDGPEARRRAGATCAAWIIGNVARWALCQESTHGAFSGPLTVELGMLLPTFREKHRFKVCFTIFDRSAACAGAALRSCKETVSF